MDTAWIQVFVLTLSECVAPPGKTVCQEQEIQYQFFDRRECESVLQQLVDYSSTAGNVILNARRSRCLPTVREQPVYESLEEANEQLADLEGWGQLGPRDQPEEPQPVGLPLPDYRERLASLPECDPVDRSPPCKVGPIIVESEDEEEMDVWRREGTGSQ